MLSAGETISITPTYNAVDKTPFSFTFAVLDKCEPGGILLSADAVTKSYTLGGPDTTIDTVWESTLGCTITYTATIENDLNSYVTFDAASKNFAITEIPHTTRPLIGDHTFTVVPTSPGSNEITDSILTFTLEILDPCEEPQLLPIFSADVDPVTYTLGAASVTIVGTGY
jgi:hypothetical protein